MQTQIEELVEKEKSYKNMTDKYYEKHELMPQKNVADFEVTEKHSLTQPRRSYDNYVDNEYKRWN